MSVLAILVVVLLFAKAILTLDSEKRNAQKYSGDKLKLLTYNVQRLPWLRIPAVNINHLLETADIVCLQEDFSIGLQAIDNVHAYKPGARLWKAVASGLSVYSRIPWISASFKSFQSSSWTDGDALADKGFIEIEYETFVLYNTHLQSGSDADVGLIRKAQMQQLLSCADRWKKKVCIVGDFNQDVRSLRYESWMSATSKEPTFDAKVSNPTEWLDGMLCKQVHVGQVFRHSSDPFADHYGVEFEIVFE